MRAVAAGYLLGARVGSVPYVTTVRHNMLTKFLAAFAAALLTIGPTPGAAQRAIPVFVPDRSGISAPESRGHGRSELQPLAVDSGAVRDKTPYVLGGAILGALAGGFFYRRELEKLDWVDYSLPYSVVISVGGGAAIGALLGYVVGSFGDPPAKRESGSRAFAPGHR